MLLGETGAHGWVLDAVSHQPGSELPELTIKSESSEERDSDPESEGDSMDTEEASESESVWRLVGCLLEVQCFL
jgi:hypothetical protein